MPEENVSVIVEHDGFDFNRLKKMAKAFNESGACKEGDEITISKVKKENLVNSFLDAVEEVPSSNEKKIPDEVTQLYNEYVDLLDEHEGEGRPPDEDEESEQEESEPEEQEEEESEQEEEEAGEQETTKREENEEMPDKKKKKSKEKKAPKKKAPAKKAPAKKEKAPAKKKDAVSQKPEKITKKSIVIDMVSTKTGATIDQMAKRCTEKGLGDYDRNQKTVGLWLKKLGFNVAKDSKGRWKKI